jgi:sulfur carrier protein
MDIILNGKPETLDSVATVTQLVEQLGIAPSQVAVELNRAIVPKSQWEKTQLNAGDAVEIVQFIGGG